MTLSFPVPSVARHTLFVVTGEDKARSQTGAAASGKAAERGRDGDRDPSHDRLHGESHRPSAAWERVGAPYAHVTAPLTGSIWRVDPKTGAVTLFATGLSPRIPDLFFIGSFGNDFGGVSFDGRFIFEFDTATDPKIGLACLVFYLIYQQLENYVIAPRVLKTTVELTPERAGSYDFTCGMGMLRGQLVVEE